MWASPMFCGHAAEWNFYILKYFWVENQYTDVTQSQRIKTSMLFFQAEHLYNLNVVKSLINNTTQMAQKKKLETHKSGLV